MASIPIEDLRKFVSRCDPSTPLDPTDERYVPLDEGDPVRGSDQMSCMEELFRTIEVSNPTDQTRQLFTGFAGTGKTTELRRLHDRLKHASDVLTHPVFIDVEDYLDRYTPISITDVLRVLAYCLDREAQVVEGKDPDTTDYLKRFWDFLNTEVEFRNLKFDAYGTSLMMELKNNPGFRAKAESALRLRFQQFAVDAQDVMGEAVVRIRRAAEVQRVVVIVDGLEKLTPLREEERALMEASVESVFFQHANFLRIPCHVIYTFPLWLRFRNPGLGAQYQREALTLPMVKIADQNGFPYQPGIKKLTELVGRRVDLKRVFGDDLDKTLVPIILASGGYPRDLLRMVREVLIKVTDFPADFSKIELVINRLAETYDWAIRAPDLEILAEVARSHKVPPSSPQQLASFGRLLETWLILAYRNGEEWFDLHPLVRRSSLIKEHLKAGSGT